MTIVHDDSFLFAALKDFTSTTARAVWARLVTATMKPCGCRLPCSRSLMVAWAVPDSLVPSEITQRIVSDWGVPVPQEIEATIMEEFIEALAAYLPEADARNVIENYDLARQALVRHRQIREV